LIWCLSLLAACDKPKHPAQEYLERLNNVLDTDVEPQETSYPNFPSARYLQLPEQDYSISIREFLSLRGCKLHDSIAQRNTQLGKVASSSQLLMNDLAIIESAPACIETLEDSKLKEKLTAYIDAKQAFLPKRLWHALLAGSEYQQFWRQAPVQVDQSFSVVSAVIVQSVSALKRLAQAALVQPKEPEPSALESSLAALRSGDAGRLLSELLEQQRYLAAADKAIEKKLESKLCLSPKPNTKAKYFQNVVNKYFIQTVQSRAVLVNRAYQELMPDLLSLEALLLDTATPAFQEWQTQRQGIMLNALDSLKGHVLNIQKLYRQCGLTVGLK
jgi:hypothetical protein